MPRYPLMIPGSAGIGERECECALRCLPLVMRLMRKANRNNEVQFLLPDGDGAFGAAARRWAKEHDGGVRIQQ